MDQAKLKFYAPWGVAVFIAIVFVQSLFFKFSNSFETQHIFGTIGAWTANIEPPDFIAGNFAAYGGYTIGTVELIASMLILTPKTQFYGAALACAVISGAIFFHLFTPLGISVIINESGDRDGGQLFALAVAVRVFAVILVWLRRSGFSRQGQ